MKEAEEASGGDSVPVAVIHRDAKNPGERAEQLVIMRPEDWARVLCPDHWDDPDAEAFGL